MVISLFLSPCTFAGETDQSAAFSEPVNQSINNGNPSDTLQSEKNRVVYNFVESLFPGERVNKPIVLIIILLVVILYSILSMIVLLIFMLIDRGRRDKKARRRHQLKERYQGALVDYLDPDIEDETFMERIRLDLNKPFNREVLINETIDLSINLQENEAAKLQELYFRLELHNDSLKKCRSSRWHRRIKGYRECAFMNIHEATPIIEKGLHSKNDIVRSEAQLSMVRLNPDDPYGFLDSLKRPFSVWEQNVIHEAITYHNLSIPEFKRWFNSQNNSVVIFSVKMVHLFEQKDAWRELIALLTHDDDKIRFSAIHSLGVLQVEESQQHLRMVYEDEIPDNQIAVLQALAKFKDLTNLVFFKHVIEMEDDVWLQVEAARGIRALAVRGEDELKSLLDRKEYRNYQIIIKHVLDKRI